MDYQVSLQSTFIIFGTIFMILAIYKGPKLSFVIALAASVLFYFFPLYTCVGSFIIASIFLYPVLFGHTAYQKSSNNPSPENISQHIQGATIDRLNGHEVRISKGGKTIVLGADEEFDPSTGHGQYYIQEVHNGRRGHKVYTSDNAGQFGKTQKQRIIEIVRNEFK